MVHIHKCSQTSKYLRDAAVTDGSYDICVLALTNFTYKRTDSSHSQAVVLGTTSVTNKANRNSSQSSFQRQHILKPHGFIE